MSKHILLIDDEPMIREILAAALTSKGYRISQATSSSEAMAVAQQDPPHLIVSDLQLEDEDGLAIIAQLKTKLPDVPVILLTGVLFEPKVVRENLSSKISCYLPKTSTLAQIVDAVSRLVN
ncbi:MAG TPA: response regulator [Opitutaceae bacterium]|jgi:DNA-binding NtrC family response regulator